MSDLAEVGFTAAESAPVLISPDLNASEDVYVTWSYVDFDREIDAGYWMVLTNDESKSFACDACGEGCYHPLDSYSDSDHSHSERRLDFYRERGVDFYTTDKACICRDCCETEPSGFGGVTFVYDEERLLLLDRFETPPATLVNALGDVQLDVLRAVAATAEFEPFELAGPYPHSDTITSDVWADRVAVTRWVATVRETTTASSCSASVSRAVHSLIDRGLLAGAYRGWREYYGDPPPENTGSDTAIGRAVYQGNTPDIRNDNERPTLQKVRLRNLGKYAVALSVL
jgi:hypothetical protein